MLQSPLSPHPTVLLLHNLLLPILARLLRLRNRSFRQHPLHTHIRQKLPSHPPRIQHLGRPHQLAPDIQSALLVYRPGDVVRNLKGVLDGD